MSVNSKLLVERLLEGSSLRGLVMLGMGFYLLLARPDLSEVALAMLASGGLGLVIPERGGRK
jgi:hypothetical protein